MMSEMIIGECPKCGGEASGFDPKYLTCFPCEMSERNRLGKTLD